MISGTRNLNMARPIAASTARRAVWRTAVLGNGAAARPTRMQQQQRGEQVARMSTRSDLVHSLDTFPRRHNAQPGDKTNPNKRQQKEIDHMLSVVGAESLEELVQK